MIRLVLEEYPILIVISKVFNAIQIAGINVQPFQGDKVVSNLLQFDDINHEDNLQMEKK